MLLEIIVRTLIGGIFAISAIGKLAAPHTFVKNVVQYRILPEPLARLYGRLLPFLELVAAILLLAGLLIPVAAILVILMTSSFIGAIITVIIRRQNLSCSCLGLLYRERVGWPTLVRDVILLMMGGFLFVTGEASPSLMMLFAELPNLTAVIGIIVSVSVITMAIYLALLSFNPRTPESGASA